MRIEDFLNYLQFEKRYPESTIKSYETDLLQFDTYLKSIPNYQSNAISNRQVRAWVVNLLNIEKLANSSVRRKLSSLNSYFNWQIKKGELKLNPAKEIATLKLPKRIPQYLSGISADQMLKDLNQEKVSLADWRNYLIVDLLYSTGIRRQELVNLKWSDIEFERKFIKVVGKGNKERHIPIAANLVQKLLTYRDLLQKELNFEVNNVFVTDKGKELYPKYVYLIVNKYLTIYSTLKKRSPHILRHTFATHLLNNGADLNDIKELLGHSSLAATQVYTHNSIEDLKLIYKQAHPKS
jgi:integrase/recombinase XerC